MYTILWNAICECDRIYVENARTARAHYHHPITDAQSAHREASVCIARAAIFGLI